jgi:hypothetical protein
VNHKGRRIIERLACERRYGIADEKGAEYSGHGKTYIEDGADTLANFKKVAERIGGTPEQVLLTYMLKHMDSITTTVREAAECKKDPKTGYYDEDHNPRHVYAASEGIVSRLDDLRNYADLLECLLVDLSVIAEPDTEDYYDRYGFLEPTRTSVGEDEPEPMLMPGQRYAGQPAYGDTGYLQEEAGPDDMVAYVIEAHQDDALRKAGLVEGLDGVWRGASKVDESVAPDSLRETPLCGPPPSPQQSPVPVSPTLDRIRGHRVDL